MKKESSGIIGIISIILIACTLRAPITGVGPLVGTLSQEFGLSATIAGLLTTLPLLAFALVSFLTDYLSRLVGAGRLMLISIIVIGAGLIIRSFLGVIGLFAGTIIIALGIGVNNVLLPPVTMAKYPEKMGSITGTYTTFMAGFASLSMGITLPLSLLAGWRMGLFVWIIVIAAACVLWLPNRRLQLSSKINAESPVKKKHVARSSETWFITLYMGLQSLIFYFTVAWFSTILQAKGYSPVTSGLYNMIMMLCGLPGSFVMPIIASKTKHQSFWGAFIGLLYTIGTISLMFAEHPVGLVVTIITNGFGSGACIAFIMVIFGLHTKNAEDASALSAFSQGIGYILGAIGPVLVGKLFDATGNWMVPLLVITGIGIATIVFGWLSGTDRMVET